MKKNLMLILGGIVLFIFIALTSFMWYRVFLTKGASPVAVLQIKLEQQEKTIVTEKSIPTPSSDLNTIEPYQFQVVNNTKKAGIYKVLLEEPTLSETDKKYAKENLLTRNQLEFQLLLNGKIVRQGKLSELSNNELEKRSIDQNQVNQYQLRIFLSEEAYNTAWQNKYYHYKVLIQTEES